MVLVFMFIVIIAIARPIKLLWSERWSQAGELSLSCARLMAGVTELCLPSKKSSGERHYSGGKKSPPLWKCLRPHEDLAPTM